MLRKTLFTTAMIGCLTGAAIAEPVSFETIVSINAVATPCGLRVRDMSRNTAMLAQAKTDAALAAIIGRVHKATQESYIREKAAGNGAIFCAMMADIEPEPDAAKKTNDPDRTRGSLAMIYSVSGNQKAAALSILRAEKASGPFAKFNAKQAAELQMLTLGSCDGIKAKDERQVRALIDFEYNSDFTSYSAAENKLEPARGNNNDKWCAAAAKRYSPFIIKLAK